MGLVSIPSSHNVQKGPRRMSIQRIAPFLQPEDAAEPPGALWEQARSLLVWRGDRGGHAPQAATQVSPIRQTRHDPRKKKAAQVRLKKYPQGESNPCFRAENPTSWATRRWGQIQVERTLKNYSSGPQVSTEGSRFLPLDRLRFAARWRFLPYRLAMPASLSGIAAHVAWPSRPSVRVARVRAWSSPTGQPKPATP